MPAANSLTIAHIIIGVVIETMTMTSLLNVRKIETSHVATQPQRAVTSKKQCILIQHESSTGGCNRDIEGHHTFSYGVSLTPGVITRCR